MIKVVATAALAVVLVFAPLSHSHAAQRPYLGFSTKQSAAEYSPDAVLDSVVVSVVKPGSPASTAGLLVGDQVIAINGHQIQGGLAGTYLELMKSLRPGDTVLMKVNRAGEQLDLTVIVGSRPGEGS